MSDRNLTLLTDLYQLTMMNGYLKYDRKDEIAVFDVFFRQNGMITYSCGNRRIHSFSPEWITLQSPAGWCSERSGWR